jgi:hypothetical protein
MASVSFGINRGQAETDGNVTVGTLAVSTNDIEVRIDQTKGLTRNDVQRALHTIIRQINNGNQAALPGV